MRIMTTNIWGDYFNNPVDVRENDVYKVYENYCPDVIGFQEVTQSWYGSDIWKKLSGEYNLIGTQLYDNFNFTPMAVKKALGILASGFEFLDDTPDTSKTITWAVLKSQDDEKVFGVCNTHFWWRYDKEEYDLIRDKNANQLSTLMKYISNRFDCPVLAFGDMNCVISHDVFKIIYPLNGVSHLYDLAEDRDNVGSNHGDPVKDSEGKFHGIPSGKDHKSCSIDHIVGYGKGYKVLRYKVIEEQYALDASDHAPVYADIQLI